MRKIVSSGRLAVACALALALAALAASGESAERSGRGGLVLVDFARVPSLASEVLVAEASAILEPIGGAAAWRIEAPGGAYAAEEIPVLLLSRAPLNRDGRILGSACRSTPRPAAWVFVDPILRALGLNGPVEALTALEARRLGLALGRVAAHEIVHALAPAEGHAPSGLMARRLHPAQLSGPRPTLDRASARGLRAGLDAWRARAASPARRPPRRADTAQASESGPR